MEREKLVQFLEQLKNDPEAGKLIGAYDAPKDQSDEICIYAEIASQLGYEITEEDLKTYMEYTTKQISDKTEAAASQIQELPDEALDKVAGGTKDHENCQDTYRNYENCWVNDGCDQVYHDYSDYVCHRNQYDDPCHETAKSCKNGQYSCSLYAMFP